ncbi:hypothetical protein [Foetidibacter luteolus]|uniref:hypothetical protein n=1 Tax=Foetidibacter luteolus TaxID=2608880 RepID=UPI00129A86F4|nr:hypothetical protein [Foetidibacter luteolus]
MRQFTIEVIITYSILLPLSAVFIRRRYLPKTFYPFIVVLILGALNETLSVWMIYQDGTNAVNSNVYVLLEYLLLLRQFLLWKCIGKKIYILLFVSGLLVWNVDVLLLHNLHRHGALFRCFASLIITLLSARQINELTFLDPGPLFSSPGFLICLAFGFYFGLKSIWEVFSIIEVNLQPQFYSLVYLILSVANGISNLLYSMAILCIKRRRVFTSS